jgi:hypothetical protein
MFRVILCDKNYSNPGAGQARQLSTHHDQIVVRHTRSPVQAPNIDV